MDGNINQNNPWEGFFERKEQERLQARLQEQERLRLQREELNNERKIQAQRIIANKQGGELAKLLTVINPNLGILGQVLDTTAGFAKQAYQALDEMSAKLSKVNASAKMLGVNIEGLQSASEMHKDIQDLKIHWQNFMDGVEVSIASVYDKIQQTERVDNLSNEDLISESKWNTFLTTFSWVMTAANPLTAGFAVSGSIHQEALNDEIKTRIDIEKKVNDALKNYEGSLSGVAGANNSLMTQLVNIVGNGSASENTLLGLASSGSNILKSQGMGNNDINLFTSQLLGFTDKLYRDMDESVEFSKIYEDVLNASTSGKLDALVQYGLGVSENSLYGYAMNYKDMDLKNNTYRDDKMTELYIDYLNWFMNTTPEAISAMDELGYEIKNNTNALQKWQWLESIGGVSTERGKADANNYYAVNSQGENITDQLYGTITQRIGQNLLGVTNYLGNSLEYVISGHNYQKTIEDSGLQFASSKYGSAIGYGLGKVDVSPSYTPEQLGFNTNPVNNTGKSLDELININVTASDNLKIEVEKIVQDHTYNTMNNMQVNPNTQSGKFSF